jgi:ubiquinone/menaquinone biosynthesis C-methylase UbiE
MGNCSVREGFDRIAEEYDAIKVRVIPGYREVQALVDRYAALPEGSPARVLELGLGTGEWAGHFLKRHPEAEFEGVDFSDRMRGIAGRRLEPFRDQVRLHATDVNHRLPRGCFDLVVSFFALHHVREKSRLVEEISSRLVEGGRFLWADITTAGTPALEQLFLDDWVAFMRQSGLDDGEISNVLQDHRENDLAEPVESQLGYMRRAALDPAAVVWSQGKFVLFFGRRSP